MDGNTMAKRMTTKLKVWLEEREKPERVLEEVARKGKEVDNRLLIS